LDPRFAGSNPTDDRGFLRAIKIPTATSFGGEVKSWSHVVKFYGMLKICTVLKRYFVGKIQGHFSPNLSCFTIRSLLVTARKLWWMNQE
jgi:hypothetical protein